MDKTLILLCCLMAVFIKSSKSEGLLTFVELKMADYSTWLKSNDLDPSPLEAGPTHFDVEDAITNLNISISDHAVRGHSNGMEVESVWGGLVDGEFWVQMRYTGNITYYGEYKANGTILSSIPISGEGDWYVSVDIIGSCFNRISFIVLPTGYLNITGVYMYCNGYGAEGKEIYFENLWDQEAAAGYEDIIRQSVFSGFEAFLENDRSYPTDPLKTMYIAYWQEVLANTTLAEIIGTTDPTATTTISATTVDPCQRRGGGEMIYSDEGKAMETVVEKWREADENGVPVTVTKTCYITVEKDEL